MTLSYLVMGGGGRCWLLLLLPYIVMTLWHTSLLTSSMSRVLDNQSLTFSILGDPRKAMLTLMTTTNITREGQSPGGNELSTNLVDVWSMDTVQPIIDQGLSFFRTSKPFRFRTNDYMAADAQVTLLPITPLGELCEQVIDDLDDRHAEQIQCGQHKCFFPSIADPQTGWLVTPNLVYQMMPQRHQMIYFERIPVLNTTDPQPTSWHGMLFGWNLSQTIQQTHRAIPHFYLSQHAPLLLSANNNVSTQPGDCADTKPSLSNATDAQQAEDAQTFLKKINRVFQAKYANQPQSENILNLFRSFRRSLWSSHGLVVQRIQRAPAAIQVIKRNDGLERFRALVRPTNNNQTEDDTTVTPRFLYNLLLGLRDLWDVLDAYPALVNDFQFAVNRKTGRISHVDLDRSYEMFQHFRPTAQAYKRFLVHQRRLMSCFFYQCVAEIILSATEFAKATTINTTMLFQGIDPDPTKCSFLSRRSL